MTILANNDLGMHCADQDYRIFSILPPFNVIGAQVILGGREPRLLTRSDGVELSYQAVASNIVDPTDDSARPSATDSINSTSQNKAVQNAPDIFKGNFWSTDGNGIDPNGFLAYDPLYPAGVLGLFPFLPDLGLPAPEVERLWLGDGELHAAQSPMPGIAAPYSANDPQPFHTFVEDFPFFTSQGFGYIAQNFRRYLAEGIPILPVDDQGRGNAYPLMRVQAHDAGGNLLAAVDTVLPVASEADCQGCHLEQDVCNGLGLGIPCDDIANWYGRGASFITGDTIDITDPTATDFVPGETAEQVALNAAKINILRLHDARHGTSLDSERFVTCATCHYSPALDLAQLGPNDDNGKQQTQHVSMSRAMHGFHGNLRDDRENDPDSVFAALFPDMPPPSERTPEEQSRILGETCYNCHPGKRTKCLRGAMETGGMVCQDCHGQSTQVGHDFTANFPDQPGTPTPGLRVPWADEPLCQSCHIGDVLQVQNLISAGALTDAAINATDKSGNTDGLRLEMAYAVSEHVTNGGDDALTLYDFANSRFASNLPLYRLSGGDDGSDKGHGGLSCEGCHGSTHAIWPNANPWANDNKTAMDLQGHTGTIIECSTCHDGDLGNTLGGPHGMHPVGGTRFADGGHEDLAERSKDACRACHGRNGEGTVLSRTAVDRTFTIEECENGTLCPDGEYENFTVRLTRGQPVSCAMCHENELRTEPKPPWNGECLLDWAESRFPQRFAPAGAETIKRSRLHYRIYSESRTTLGYSDATQKVY
ncbi:cytochrome c3 family protein [uncultured Thiohalocapsa sp.]|uniref:cytochrome c3 family protein n=1 Tax=uncultured Thiohalocapsa sp. TaxID=768990 RepID=UPI0025D4831D|nr:cytochrome c3 family protein [uncultured Thiohalocapsa sp.]